MRNQEQYLKSGEQSKITERIEDISVSEIKGEDFEYIFNLIKWIRENIKYDKTNWMKHFRNRTAHEIIESGFSVGCGDTTLVFCTLARAKGIPSVFIEAVYKEWLEEELNETWKNHCFARIYLNNSTYLVDPIRGNVGIRNLKMVGGDIDYVIMNEGLDPWEFGIKDWDSHKNKYSDFRDKWKKENLNLT